jgi:hypothetical protein
VFHEWHFHEQQETTILKGERSLERGEIHTWIRHAHILI